MTVPRIQRPQRYRRRPAGASAPQNLRQVLEMLTVCLQLIIIKTTSQFIKGELLQSRHPQFGRITGSAQINPLHGECTIPIWQLPDRQNTRHATLTNSGPPIIITSTAAAIYLSEAWAQVNDPTRSILFRLTARPTTTDLSFNEEFQLPATRRLYARIRNCASDQ